MKKLVILLLLISSCTSDKNKEPYNFTIAFEDSKGTETATYEEVITFYTNLADAYSEVNIETIGETDSGKPLHMVTLNPDLKFDYNKIRENKRIILINNGIHPGESDGIDATMMLYRDIVQEKIETPKNTILVTIPVYNIGGSLNRNSTTRANQNGPKEYGFRGNARNYDLNRDFIKCDTKNARTFTKIFHIIQPDVFIDNHVSNGADYQYALTHLFTQHNKLGGDLGSYLHTEMMPKLEQKLATKNWDITPYVNVFNQVPEKGFSQFMDYPRYSTGYTTLFNTLGMMVETHMLKPYKQRVEGTYELMKSMITIVDEDTNAIKTLRENSFNLNPGELYPLDWKIDSTKTTVLNFKGYEGSFIPSEITGAQRLKYDRTKPFTKKVTYQNYFKPSKSIVIPQAYIIPQSLWNVIDLLKLNNVEMTQFKKDTIITVESYKIKDYETRAQAYEGHYQHYNTNVSTNIKALKFIEGDYLIKTNQKAIRYLIETLEPQAPDSFFNWNFFDTILQQKEYFSPYVFEETAKKILATNPELKKEFDLKKSQDATFKTNWYVQLDWIYKHSSNYEKAHLQYPIYRIE
ncbi:M14 family metallopeptidase [Ichthyenterobacterium magnum]|uniref:Zinc carboxypeptidase n=1 Tax=Ichthyenterobacterium magnum TaxID=1230530 RepID=A0A420DEY1_9FLAO|nr:M14 family metallopeptidase [Ichthyenterobacterium magnum]RKE90911.1 zinc carboxypeptidase [Ichthyenterobacterium magnum]